MREVSTRHERTAERRERRVLAVLLTAAFVVSVVHYVDNVGNHDAYPQGGDLPTPSAGSIAVAWFVFTASGAIGAWLFLRGSRGVAACFLAGYALSGLVGLGHYTVPGATSMPWWRQGHVVLDVLCGAALLVFSGWLLVSDLRE